MQYIQIAQDTEKIIKTSSALINLLKIFSDDSPGPFDFYMVTNYYLLAVTHFASGEYDESIKYFEDLYNSIERFKIFSETKEITSDFIKLADKDKFLYNMPFDYKKHVLMSFEAFANMPADSNDYKNYTEISKRDDFQKFVDKLKA
jgi:hypothetical protein